MPANPKRIYGLYAITPDMADTDELVRRARLAMRGGARVVQYRNKSADVALRLAQTLALKQAAGEFGVTFIINDDAQLALQVGADGVHLGAADGSVAAARALLGAEKIIGVSCYNHILAARQAVAAGADYVAFGAFFASSVKPDAVAADAGLLRQARAELSLPLVAIGGITAQNAAPLIKAGADAVAVISALWGAQDIQAAAREFSMLFDFNRPHH
jgi:thiamine-phosphate pyrophosphorylase